MRGRTRLGRSARRLVTSVTARLVIGRRVSPLLLLVLTLILVAACAQNDPPVPEAASYDRERVVYASQDVQLSGILWMPRAPGPHPAIVLVDGSGQTTAERLEPWARRFTEWGLACLSYDKRGVGASGGRYIGGFDIDIPLLARDAVAGVRYLKTRDEIDGSRIGLLGQSQAGWIIPVAAAESPDVSFTVVLSGATVTLGEEGYFSRLSGDDPFWRWIYRDLSLEEISRRLAERGPSLFDPRPYLERVTVPGLWLYGAEDRSQPTRESVRILDELIEGDERDFTYTVFDNADHGLRINGTTAEGVYELVEEWIGRQLRESPPPTPQSGR